MTVIAANSWLTLLFGVSMQPLFDMINSLQITALLPLNKIVLPANAMELFEVIIAIVAFDYFPLYDPGYTETESYSAKFDWFGFGGVNFIGLLGTFLGVIIWILVIQTINSVIIYFSIGIAMIWSQYQ